MMFIGIGLNVQFYNWNHSVGELKKLKNVYKKKNIQF